MTDNRSNTQNDALKNETAAASTTNTSQPNRSQTLGAPNSTTTEQQAANSNLKASSAAEPKMKKVDISIAGVSYQIYCPVDEEQELRSAVYYINNFALDIKREAPSLGQENLLVLSCLNLYEKINANKKTDDSRRHEDKQTEALLNKIMKDAQTIL